MKFKANTKSIGEGKVYIMWFKFRECEEKVYKIGYTAREEPIDRMLEVLRSYYMNKNNRYIPESYIKRFRKTGKAFAKEAMLHKYFKEYQYEPKHKFDGCTELFIGLDEEVLLKVYEDCLAGIDINEERYKDGK